MQLPFGRELAALSVMECRAKLTQAANKQVPITFPQPVDTPPAAQPLSQAQQNALQFINQQLHELNARMLEIGTLNAQARLGLMSINIEQARAQIGWLVSQIEAAEFRHQQAMSQIQQH